MAPLLRIFACFAVASLLLGCDQGKPGKPGGPQAGDAPDAPTTRATSRPSTSALVIAGREYSFPAARVQVEQVEPRLQLLLFSDDPVGAALDSNYRGNRYYLRLELLPGSNQAVIDQATARYRDRPDGIYLEGKVYELQPYRMQASFTLHEQQLAIHLQGRFLQFKNGDRYLPEETYVQGDLTGASTGPAGAAPPPPSAHCSRRLSSRGLCHVRSPR